MTTEQDKSDLIQRAAQVARPGSDGPPAGQVADLLTAYYRHVAAEDLLDRTPEDLYGAFASHFRTARVRPQGRSQVHVFTPTLAEHGWSAGGHSVVEVVTDDMPFLVDSVMMELTQQQRDLHLVIHPQFDATRDLTGDLSGLVPVADESAASSGDTVRESWMHFEISRIGHDEDLAAIQERIDSVLRDVRESVEDWDKMRARALSIVDELETPPPGLEDEEVSRSREFLRWLADDHFTFLGYREYQLEDRDGGEYLVGVPGTGYGILRADQSPSAARLPDKVSTLR